MKKHLSVAVIAFCCPMLVAVSAPLTPRQALERALPSLPSYIKLKTRSASDPDNWQLKYTSPIPGNESTPGCYLYKSPDGYIVAAADDRAVGLLAYGDSISTENMSPEVEWWLGEYGRQMAAAADVPAETEDDTSEMDGYAPITPICKTRWSQFAPYYDDCSKAYGQPVVTGCVSTAMAQVMKAHEWPKGPCTGGTHTYTWDGHTFSFDYDGVVFDWAQMKNGYLLPGTEQQRAAVAQLFYAVGVSVDMHYHPGGSAANPGGIPYALIDYFDYDKGAAEIQRDYYGLQEWNILIYDQLKNYGPVQYSGWTPSGGGHSFVCDGYSHNGFFHINWGWAEDDGYYRLTALAANHKGQGGIEAEGGFDFNQDVIINIKPAAADFKGSPYINLLNSANVSIGQSQVTPGDAITIHGAYWNETLYPINGNFGVEITGEKGDTTYVDGPEITEYKHGEGRRTFNVTLPDTLATGNYKLYPAFKTGGQWYAYRTHLNATPYVEMNLADKSGTIAATFSSLPADTIAAPDFTIPDNIKAIEDFPVNATVVNNGAEEYYGGVKVAFYSLDDKLLGESMPIFVDISPNGEYIIHESVRVKSWPDNKAPQSGDVLAYLVSASGKPISAAQKIMLEGEDEKTAISSYLVDGALNGTLWTLEGYMIKDKSKAVPGIYIFVDNSGATRKIIVR